MIWELESSWCAITLSAAVIMVWTFHGKSRFFSLITGFISFWNKVKKSSGSFLIEVL